MGNSASSPPGNASANLLQNIRAELGAELRVVDWRLMLLIPLGAAFFVAIAFSPYKDYFGKKTSEFIAPAIAAAMFGAYLLRWAVTRRALYLIFSVMGLCFLMREIFSHVATKPAIAVLALCLVWLWRWRDRCREGLADRAQISWLVLAIVTYVFSQMCAHRFYKVFYNGRAFHEQLEEGSENLGHLFMLVSALAGSWKPAPTSER